MGGGGGGGSGEGGGGEWGTEVAVSTIITTTSPSGGSDSVLRVWSLVSGELLKAIPTNTLSHVALSASTSHQYHPAIFLASGERLQLLQP